MVKKCDKIALFFAYVKKKYYLCGTFIKKCKNTEPLF